MNKVSLYTLIGLFALCSCACGGKDPVPSTDPDPKPEPPVEVYDATLWTTTFDKTRDFEKSGVAFGKAATMSPNVVRFTDETFQTVDGFGLAITQASCYNLLKMSQEDRTKLLTELFSPTAGAGSSLIRVCIGGSDFSMDEYTWCDKEGMANFAVHESEKTFLFPILDEIYKINPAVQIIGSPWSCPRWMKMDVQGNGNPFNSWTSGRLNPKYYADYADYFVKWIQEMQKRGYKVLGVTLQNEPLNHGNSMSLYMPWEDQRDFLKVIGPAFEKAGLKTEIMLFDHNYNYDDKAEHLRRRGRREVCGRLRLAQLRRQRLRAGQDPPGSPRKGHLVHRSVHRHLELQEPRLRRAVPRGLPRDCAGHPEALRQGRDPVEHDAGQ